jgi:hypothetical protein
MSRLWEQVVHAFTGRVNAHAALPDLRELDSRRVAVERTHYLVNDTERRGSQRRLYVLRRDVADRRSHASIAVFANGRGVGYLPDRIARDLAPRLDELGGAAIVNGAGVMHGSIRLRVDVPTAEALADFARAHRAPDREGDEISAATGR